MKEYLNKLRVLANGGARATDEIRDANERRSQKQWWDGYQQCLMDVEAELDKQLVLTPDTWGRL